MTGYVSGTPVRYRRIDLTLTSIDAVNAATRQSTIYYYPFSRTLKRKRSSSSPGRSSTMSATDSSTEPRLRGQPNSELHSPASPSSIYSQDSGIAMDHDGDMAYDPDSDYDMVRETENFLDLEFEDTMRTLRSLWEDASAREKSRIRGALAMLLAAIRIGNRFVFINLSTPTTRD